MSAHSEKPPRDEVKNRVTDEGRTFKKTESVHGRPRETDHDLHEDLMRDPPNVSTKPCINQIPYDFYSV